MKECQIRPHISKALKKITLGYLSEGSVFCYLVLKFTVEIVLVSPIVVWTGDITNCS